MIYTTLNRIREQDPCAEGWQKLLKHIGKKKPDDELVSYITILESNGLDDALWCCRAEPEQTRAWRLFAVECAEYVRHLMTDPRSTTAIDVARCHAYGQASDSELAAALEAARAAAMADWGAACGAAWAAWDAACGAAWDAARAARAASMAAACGADWEAAWAELATVFRNIVTTHGESE